MEEIIGPFKLYKSKPCSMKYGKLYIANLDFETAIKEKTRNIRVWIPSNYDSNKQYPVIYMSDGQNIVDKYTTSYGDWKLDRVLHRIKKDIIIVGIDCPKDFLERHNELCPPYANDLIFPDEPVAEPCGDVYLDFLINTVKPLIEKYFSVSKERKLTAIGGSSMGGIMAFYGASKYPNIFGFSLCFSPAFFLYNCHHLNEGLAKWKPNKKEASRYYFYVGGQDLDKDLQKDTFRVFNYLKKRNFNKTDVALVFDSNQKHNEEAWSKYVGDAILWWLNN